LLGISVSNPFAANLSHSVLFRYQKEKTAEPLSFNSIIPDSPIIDGQSGYYHEIFTFFKDMDEPLDGLYDEKHVFDLEETHQSWDRSSGLILNNSYSIYNWTFGFRYTTMKTYWDNTGAFADRSSPPDMLRGFDENDPSFSIQYSRFDVETLFEEYRLAESGDFLRSNDSLERTFLLSVMRPVYGPFGYPLELRGDLGYSRSIFNSNIHDMYSGRYDYFDPDINNYEKWYSESFDATLDQEIKGRAIYISASAKQVFHQASERRNDGFWSVSGGYMWGNYDYSDNDLTRKAQTYTYFDGLEAGGLDTTSLLNMNRIIRDNGTASRGGWFGAARLNIPLGNKVYFGIGFNGYRYKGDLTTDFSDSASAYKNYDVTGQSLPDVEYQSNVYAYYKSTRLYEMTSTGFSIPVGIEYRFTRNNRWAIRFGAIFQYQRDDVNESEQVLLSHPQQKEIRWGNGNEKVDILTDNEYASTSAQEEEGRSMTLYVYGLGYQPTDYLQIDLLGFFGTDHNNSLSMRASTET